MVKNIFIKCIVKYMKSIFDDNDEKLFEEF